MRNIVHVIGMALIVAGVNTANATLIDVEFKGEVTRVDPTLEPFFSIGDQMVTSITYDSTATIGGGNEFVANYYDAIESLKFTVGSFSGELVPPLNLISVVNVRNSRIGHDGISFKSNFLPNLAAFRDGRFSLSLIDLTATVFDSRELPTSIDVADFQMDGFSLLFFGPGNQAQHVHGETYGLSEPPPTPVPESSSIALIGMGLAGLIVARRRK